MYLIKSLNHFKILLFALIFLNNKIYCDDATPITNIPTTIPITILTTIPEICPCSSPCTKGNCSTIFEGHNCKFFFWSNQCIECENYKPYYSLKDGLCISINQKTNDTQKVIYGENEIIEGDCPEPFKNLGDYCYPPTYNIIEVAGNQYKCIDYFYILKKDGFLFYNCLDSNKTCSTNMDFTIKGTKQCFHADSSSKFYDIDETNNIVNFYNDNCPSNKTFIKRESNNFYSYIYRCTENCKTGEFSYKEIKNEGNMINYCLDECPTEAKYYYEIDNLPNHKANECLESCDKNHYSIGNKCQTECNGIITVDLNRNIFACENKTECPDLFPYLYIDKNNNDKKYCLKSCKDTRNDYFNINGTYETGIETYINDTMKDDQSIIKECLSINEGFYIDTISLKWVKDCQNTYSGIYHNKSHCMNSCPKYYTFNDKECVEACQENITNISIYLDNETNTCYEKCPSNLGRGFLSSDQKYCQSCDIPRNLSNIIIGKEGFYKMEDKICLSSCEYNYTYNYGENICFTGGCTNKYGYEYSPYNLSGCYLSCSDIEDGSYKIELNKTCYKKMEDIPVDLTDYYYYITSSDIRRYISKYEDVFEELFQQNFKYLKNLTEYVKECDENDYKVLQTGNEFGKCYSNLTLKEDKYKYYNNSKILSEECKFLIIFNGSSDNETEIDGENCVLKCPKGFYEYVDDKKCRNQYDNNYFVIEESDYKKCINESKCDKYKYIPNDNSNDPEKKCVDICYFQNDKKTFSFYNSSNFCFDSCINNTDENYLFSEEAKDNHAQCLSECSSNQYYYENENICFNDCGKDFYKKGDKQKCVKNCENNEYIHPGNICSNETCPSSAPFYYEINLNKTESGGQDFIVKKCVPNCENYEEKYKFYEIDINNKKCVFKCQNLTYNGRCYDKCPSGLYQSDSECVPKCDPNIFKEDNNGNLICIKKCPEEDDKSEYLTSYGKCVKDCPEGENYINLNKTKCLTNCGNYFYKKQKSNNQTYDIYECMENCGNDVYIEGTKECIEGGCGANYYLYNNKTCYQTCSSTDKPFSAVDSSNNNISICNNECIGYNKYYGKDKICIADCKILVGSQIINDLNYECVSKCDLNSAYKFLQEKENNQNHCQINCDKDKNFDRYIMPNYICTKNCTKPNNFVVYNNTKDQLECLSKCPSNDYFAQYDPQKDEYFCTIEECYSNSTYKFYYLEDKICLDSCKNNDYLKKDTNMCLSLCESQNLFYDDDKKECVKSCKEVERKNYTKLNGHCGEKCDEDDYYNEYDLVCRTKCPPDQKIDEHICRQNCSNSPNNKYEDENGICVEKCENSKTGYVYYNKDFVDKCQNNCDNKYIKGNTCVNSCLEDEINVLTSQTTKFYDGNICISSCPPNKRFIIYNQNNNSPPFKCLSDCPLNYTYYSIITIENLEEPVYACKNNCPAYIFNPDQNLKARICFDNGVCSGNNPYYIQDDKYNNKQCLSQCPEDKPYYKSENNQTQNIECLQECPNNYVHMTDKYECIPFSECDTKKIKYKNKECVKECSKNDKIFVKDEFSYCIANCSELDSSITQVSKTLLLTYDNKCVISCPVDSEETNDKTCECSNLFYIDKSTQKKNCITQSITSCNKFANYPINIEGTKECVDYCDGILTSSGTKCYRQNYNCTKDYEILVTLTNGDKICDCIDKYYYYFNNENKEKKCLKKGESCPSSFKLLITETKECVNACPNDYAFEFQTTCVSNCPDLTNKEEGTNKCTCKNKWFIDKDNNNIVCLEENKNCPDMYPLYINNQCVESCIGTENEIYFNKTCVKNCDSNYIETTTDNDNLAKKYAKKRCKCKNSWYYDEMTELEECYIGNEEKNCSIFSNLKYKYSIYSTKECVYSCTGNYPYEFNNLCFKNCNEYKNLDITSVKDSKKCICKEYSEYDENNNDVNHEIKCLTLEYCKNNINIYSIITESKQCYKIVNGMKCPNNYPIYYNGYCYKEDDCPDGTKYNPFEQKCQCRYNWYIDNDNSRTVCLSETANCPSTYPYLVFSSNECKSNNDNNLFEFNYVLYSSCPENTERENEDSIKCICVKNKYWYEKQTLDGKRLLECGKEECPTDKPYSIDGNINKECITTCGEKYLYRGICYEKCPVLTEVGNNNECVLSPVNNELTLDNLEQEITNKLVDLYKKSNIFNSYNSTSSQKIMTKDATVEFYGVNKKNKGNPKENIKSDLSYIDISDCVEKIYKSNGMENNDDIVILKFDINNAPKNFLINPVEYKFINSRTGSELDASVCEHNSIKISYPLHDLINRYDNRMKIKRNLEYIKLDLTSNNRDSLREKLDKGKEIQELYSNTDIFNINDKIYSDICIAVEIDGKDLVLQDRINYFYPQMSLCENNCTYNHTDYVNERIYCDCSYKKEFDFKREYTSSFELNTEEIKHNQGSNTNIDVIKCISNLNNKKSLSGNFGFIFILIILIVEFILFLIIIFYGINSLLHKLKIKKEKDEGEEDDQIKVNIITTTNDKKEKETQRKLNAPPPKKQGEYGMEFIPQEYVFLFFNQNEKGVIKKVEKDGVPFKTKYNTRILLEKNKGINYDNMKSRGPFPNNQNVLIIVDNINDSLSEYIDIDKESEDSNNEDIKNTEDDINIKINKNKKPKKTIKKSEKSKSDKSGKNEKEMFSEKVYSKKKMDYSISDYDPSDENYSEIDFDEDEDIKNEKGIIESIKKEQRLIKKNYEFSLLKKKSSNFFISLLTEILDKIYIIKILLFTRKFDILSLHLSVYFLCHTLLLILLALFFDIKTIEKIWSTDNYPGLGFYLLYGLISCLVIWIFYTIILCLWSNNDKIKDILRIIHARKKYGINKNKLLHKKYTNLTWKIKFKVIVYTIIEFLLLSFCFIYFVTFCSVYTGTKSKVFKSYGIALIEVLIIKIIYGIILGVLRKISLDKNIKTLYDVVLFMNTYLV